MALVPDNFSLADQLNITLARVCSFHPSVVLILVLISACCCEHWLVETIFLGLCTRSVAMTIPFGEPEPTDRLLSKSVASTRLRAWLQQRLRHLASAQRIQDARALRSEFLVD